MSLKIKVVNKYATTDGKLHDLMESAIAHQQLVDVSKILRLNIEGISIFDHDRFVRKVIEMKDEIYDILKS